MTISELGSLGELIGSVAVVVTLVDLSTQLSHPFRARVESQLLEAGGAR